MRRTEKRWSRTKSVQLDDTKSEALPPTQAHSFVVVLDIQRSFNEVKSQAEEERSLRIGANHGFFVPITPQPDRRRALGWRRM